jgi:AraC-like DNA-binding protein
MIESAENRSLTSYIGSALGVAKTLDLYGIDGSAALAEVGIDVDAVPGFDTRIPMRVLHDALSNHIPDGVDPLFGLNFAKNINPINYHAFGVMLTSSLTLRDFGQRLQRYYAYLTTGERVEFNDSGELVYKQVVPAELGESPFEVLLHSSAWAATMLKMIRAVVSPAFAPRLVTFSFATPQGYTADFDHYFNCDIEYDAPQTSLQFVAEDLDQLLPGGNAQLARHSEKLVYDYLQTIATEVDIVNAARMTFFELLPRGDFALESLAAALSMSKEKLAGQLKVRGTSYQQLLGDARRELAEEYIVRVDLSVNEIAYMLGFSDCSNFARSFRRWTGQSPTDFRENLRGGS